MLSWTSPPEGTASGAPTLGYKECSCLKHDKRLQCLLAHEMPTPSHCLHSPSIADAHLQRTGGGWAGGASGWAGKVGSGGQGRLGYDPKPKTNKRNVWLMQFVLNSCMLLSHWR